MTTTSSVPQLRDRPDILRWQPPTWDGFVGNRHLKRCFQRLLKKIRRMGKQDANKDRGRLCFLVTGLSRSGKTAMVRFLVRCLTCRRLDPISLNPCDGTCENCNGRFQLFGNDGAWGTHGCSFGDGPLDRLEFHPIDCSMVYSPKDFADELIKLSATFDGIRLMFLDEVHRLVKRGLDEMLLRNVEDKQYIWILSTAKPTGLEDMLMNRFLKLRTERPEPEILQKWLVERCHEWGIRWESEAVRRVVEKCNCVPGTALHALALAALDDDEGLSLDLVENEWQVSLDD